MQLKVNCWSTAFMPGFRRLSRYCASHAVCPPQCCSCQFTLLTSSRGRSHLWNHFSHPDNLLSPPPSVIHHPLLQRVPVGAGQRHQDPVGGARRHVQASPEHLPQPRHARDHGPENMVQKTQQIQDAWRVLLWTGTRGTPIRFRRIVSIKAAWKKRIYLTGSRSYWFCWGWRSQWWKDLRPSCRTARRTTRCQAGWLDRSSRYNSSIQFSLFCIAHYHKLQICLRGHYNLYTYDIPDLWPHIGSGKTLFFSTSGPNILCGRSVDSVVHKTIHK